MANETYEDFAIGTSKREKEEGIKFGVIEKHEFSNITIKNENGEDCIFRCKRVKTI